MSNEEPAPNLAEEDSITPANYCGAMASWIEQIEPLPGSLLSSGELTYLGSHAGRARYAISIVNGREAWRYKHLTLPVETPNDLLDAFERARGRLNLLDVLDALDIVIASCKTATKLHGNDLKRAVYMPRREACAALERYINVIREMLKEMQLVKDTLTELASATP